MKARQAIQGHKDVRGLARPELFFSLARVVWLNDIPLARTLILCSKIAAEHLFIDNGTVTISQPNEFEEQYIAARASVTRKKIESLSSHDTKSTTPSMRSRTRNLSTQLKLWTVAGKKNLLVGIVLPDGFICTTAQDIFNALISHWKPTFAHKKIDVTGATSFA